MDSTMARNKAFRQYSDEFLVQGEDRGPCTDSPEVTDFSMDLKGRWPWFMLTLVKVISSQQLCPNNCLQCDLNMKCLKCVDGYYGELCNIPCDPVCRNGKCRIDGSCYDIIERAVWKIRRMRRNTGVNCHDAKCTCCKSNYTGPNCQVRCPNCRTRYNPGACDRYCEAGFYGGTCDKNCPENCAPGNAGKPLCKKATGECSNNCKPGFFMKMCNKTCPKDCKNGICLPISGSCVDCNDKSYGVECKEKCLGCKGGCYKNGTCVQGCAAGYHGELCDRRCGTDCSEGGRCRLYTGQLKEICSTKCRYIPASPNVIEECIAAASSEHDSLKAETNTLAIVVPVVIIIIIIIVVGILVFILWRKKRCCFRTTGEETTGEASGDANDHLVERTTGEGTSGEVGGAANAPLLKRTTGEGTSGEVGGAANAPLLKSDSHDSAPAGYDDNHEIKMHTDEPAEKTNVKPNDTPKKGRMPAGETMEERNDKPNDTPNAPSGRYRMPAGEPMEERNDKPNDSPNKDRLGADEPMEKRNDKPNYTPGKDRMHTDEPAENTNVKPNDTPKKGRMPAVETMEERNDKPNDTPNAPSGRYRMHSDGPTEKMTVKPNKTPRKDSVQAMRQLFENQA